MKKRTKALSHFLFNAGYIFVILIGLLTVAFMEEPRIIAICLIVIFSVFVILNVFLYKKCVTEPLEKLTKSFSEGSPEIYGTELEDEIGELAREVKTTIDHLHAVNRAKTSFLASMSHEIRTPMNAIMGVAEIMMMRDIPKDVEESLITINDSCNLLLSIINDVLDFSKIEAGKLEIHPIQYETASLINDSTRYHMSAADNKPIKFEVNADKNIPALLVGDEVRVKQIIHILLSNAFKYTEAGNVALSVSFERERKYLVINVTDTGHGMKPEQLEQMISENSLLHMKKHTFGTGLGLTIIRRLVELMDGVLDVESKYGIGSKFTVKIPQVIANNEVIGADTAKELNEFRMTVNNKVKPGTLVRRPMPYGSVLVVDDVVTNLFVATRFLDMYDIQYDTAASGSEAIEMVKNKVYDMILMDHMMPEPDGIETVKIIRDAGYTAPIIALTANAVVGQEEIFMQNGFDGFIPKPIDVHRLDAMLNKFIRDKQPKEVLDKIENPVIKEGGAYMKKTIFVIDDNTTNLSAAEEVLHDNYRVIALTSAAKMFSALEKIPADLILLDIEMPKMSGFEAMKLLRASDKFDKIPVIFLTGREDAQSEAHGIELGAVDFIQKPFSAPVLLNRIKTHLEIDETIRKRTDELLSRQDELIRIKNGIVFTMADLVEKRDKDTGGHIDRTSQYMRILLDGMLEYDVYTDEILSWDMDSVVSSSRLHDVGKIAISDAILNKPGRLTEEEFEVMKTHSAEGAAIIERAIHRTGDAEFLLNAKDVAEYHHEKWNGGGYPAGLKGDKIPLLGRIMAIIDVYDALVSSRPYKKAFTHEEAYDIITSEAEKHFDPLLIKVFVSVSEKIANASTAFSEIKV